MSTAKTKTAVAIADPRGGWTSASNAAADLRCQGRHFAQKRAPKRQQEESEDASFGKKVHEALLNENPEGLTTAQIKVYEQCIDIRENLVFRVFGDDAPNIKVIKERRFKVSVLQAPARPGMQVAGTAGRYEHSAQADWVGRLGNRLLIVEYKTLPGDVPSSPENEQLRDQVVCVTRTLVASNAITAVIQPLVTHEPELCEYDAAAIGKAEQEMFTRVRNSNNPEAHRTPNPVSCKFCTATVICPEYQEWAGSRLPQTQSLSRVPIASWTPEQRAEFCTMMPVAQKWLDDCKAEMKRLLKEDETCIPGFYLKPGSERTTITDPQKLFDRLVASSAELTAEQLLPLFMECVTVLKGDFEGLVRKSTGLKGKALLGKMSELIDGITETKQSDSSLAKLK